MNVYGKLTFNGYTFPNYEIVSVGKSESNLFAKNRSITTEDGVRLPLFVDFKDESFSLSFDLIKVDKNRNPLAFTKSEIFDLQRRLYSHKEIGVLQIKEKEGIIFYGGFIGEAKETFLGGVQYLSLEFQSISPHCYSSIMTEYHRVKGTKVVEIYNKSNANERIPTDIEIEMLNGNEIEIINLTTNKKTTVSNMQDLEKLYIYGETSEFVSKVNSDRNIFKLSSKKVIDFAYGKNTIKINVKDAKVRFIYQYELLLC